MDREREREERKLSASGGGKKAGTWRLCVFVLVCVSVWLT